MSAAALLAQLADLKAAAAITKADYEARRREILSAVQAELDALAAEFEPVLETAAAREKELEAEVKAAVIAGGESVKAAGLNAVFVRGREAWDGRALAGYAAAGHPEILTFQTIGEPSVQIRVSK